MTSPQYRRRRLSKLTLESLDDRIVPSAAGSAIHAQALEARAEHAAEVRAERLQQMEIRAEHQAEIRAERAAAREQRAEQRAELRAARIQARQAHLAALHALRFGGNSGTNAAVHIGAFSAARAVTPVNSAATTSTQQPSVVINPNNATSPSAAADSSASNSTSTTTTTSSGRPVVIDGNMSTVTVTTNSTSAASTDVTDVKNGPMAKAGQNLITVYTQFQNFNGSGTFALTGDLANLIRIQGDSVGVDVGANPSNMTNVESALQALGMQITATDATTGTIEGFLPISQLPTVSQDSDVLTLAPNYLPVMPPPVNPAGGIQAL